ncbi:MAG TPA: LuxR C-terminal-related transcriptional regulator [Anaerolineae bacterium]
MRADTLLQTKLHIPQQPAGRADSSLVLRPRLSKKLDAGLSRKLTLVSSAAGSGKTTLLSEWGRGRPRPVAWLSLDKGDNDPTRFWTYFIAALQRLDAGLGQDALRLLQTPQPPPLEKILTSLINEIAAVQERNKGDSPYTAILDDYYFIETEHIHETLAFLLDHLPPCFHLVIATRADPPLPLARLRAKGQLNEVRAADLRFTPDEAAVFLNQVMGLNLADEDVVALNTRTEGWIAGLQLAALSVQGHDDVQRFVRSFAGSNRYILDYLIEEVFKQRPPGTRDFLLQTSILDRFCGDLCDALLETGDWRPETTQSLISNRQFSQQILEQLEAANLFIVPLDDKRHWYRYHHLFADLLRHRLEIRYSQVHVARLHLRASRWYEAQGLTGEAIEHALAAADWERASTLILSASEMMLKRSHVGTLLRWFRALPQSEILARPRLCHAYSWPLMLTGQLGAAETYLTRAEEAAKADPDFLPDVVVAQAYSARVSGDDSRTIVLSQRALSLLGKEDLLLRGLVTMNLGIAYWNSGQLDAAEEALSEAEAASGHAGNVYSQLTALSYLGRIQAVRGRLHQAARRQRQGIRIGKGLPAAAASHLELSVLYYEWNELDAAGDHLQQVFEMSQRSGNVEAEVGAYHMLARLEQARGNEAAARAALEKAQPLTLDHKVAPVVRAQSIAYHVQIALAQGDLATAQRWGTQVDELIGMVPIYALLGLVPVRLLLAQNEKAAAAAQLEACYSKATRDSLQAVVVKILVLQALASPTEADGLAYLAEALALARPQGYIRTFVDEGQAMAALLRRALEQEIAPNYTANLLSHFPDQFSVSHQQAPLVEPLSEREVEVLQHLAAGQTYQEIAQTLFISVNTVKTHLQSIYGKLEVSNRRQATAKAKALDLLP